MNRRIYQIKQVVAIVWGVTLHIALLAYIVVATIGIGSGYD